MNPFRLFASAVLFSSLLTAAPKLWITDDNNNLGTVDVATRAVQVIGNMGIRMNDISWSPTGVLYAVGNGSLYTLNPNTGVPTLVGPLGVPILNALVFSSSGVLYGASTSLYTVNTTTGAATLVGSLGSGFTASGDLAFSGGALYLTTIGQGLITINTTTGLGTLVGTHGIVNLFGVASPNNTTLYAAGGPTGTGMYTLNPATAAPTLLFDYGGAGLNNALGMAFFGESGNTAPEFIPTVVTGTPALSTLAAALLALGVALLALRGLART